MVGAEIAGPGTCGDVVRRGPVGEIEPLERCENRPQRLGTDLLEWRESVLKNQVIVPTSYAAGRASACLQPQIVILVVVGSSPISHPK